MPGKHVMMETILTMMAEIAAVILKLAIPEPLIQLLEASELLFEEMGSE
jgi:hypothetical protein